MLALILQAGAGALSVTDLGMAGGAFAVVMAALRVAERALDARRVRRNGGKPVGKPMDCTAACPMRPELTQSLEAVAVQLGRVADANERTVEALGRMERDIVAIKSHTVRAG